MTQLGFFIDLTKCTGCQTCTVACKDAHNLEVGRNFRKVLEAESGSWKQDKAPGAWHQDVCAYYVSIACNHCADPACVKVCQTKAHAKHPELGGLVLIDRQKCIGCGACMAACPYLAPKLERKARKMTKCDACLDRISKGGTPVCVEACTPRALDFGWIDELRAKYGEGAHIVPLPSPAKTKPNLVVKPAAKAEIVK